MAADSAADAALATAPLPAPGSPPSASPSPSANPAPVASPAALGSDDLVTSIYSHRERLFVSAVQLLDDAPAAQQLVSETLREAAKQLPPLEEPSRLGPLLDRMLVSLALVRLKALPVAKPAARPLLLSSASPLSSALAVSLGGGATASSRRTTGSRDDWRPIDDGLEPNPGPRDSAKELERSDGRSSKRQSQGSHKLEQLDRTAEALATLPIEPRLAVMLVVMQGRSTAEAARLLGAPTETFRFFLANGRKLLRRALQDDLLTDDETEVAAGLLAPPGAAPSDGEGSLHDLRGNKKATARA